MPKTQYYFKILLPLFYSLNLKFWELHVPPLVNKSVLVPLTSPGSLLRIPSPSLNLQYTQKSIIQEPSYRPSPPWNFSDPSNQETSSYFCFFLFLFCFVLIYKGLWMLVVKFILTQPMWFTVIRWVPPTRLCFDFWNKLFSKL